ncbi:Pseudouridylate synthase 10 [Seminavis robusta]|uniref:Pseudouridylate synthase 10 n=1 Tax=Seminavis robusta TaxID=568900 RepID=A0A9N8DYN9_9STRA|nr:Pseudouridylate synthase 10 [Seminavis robusta]|eukprot:Sro347_g123010.1 Pseudouridylate synthase 10 (491) ;mRNA; f:52450-53922
MVEQIERFVPAGKGSLVDDAPGWSSVKNNSSDPSSREGPICWKCRGTGEKKDKKKKRKHSEAVSNCSVCQGKGHLPPKQQEVVAQESRPGEITRARQSPPNWTPQGPVPAVLLPTTQSSPPHNLQKAIQLVRLAETANQEILVILPESQTPTDDNNNNQEISVKSPFQTNTEDPIPPWLPRRGEQLCNLMGQWRILQRVASHRWTTDDLVTSFLAGRVSREQHITKNNNNKTIRYLDLGCGNGSVLLMTTWQLLKNHSTNNNRITCTGVEARQEAVELARRSIAFNVGDENSNNNNCTVNVHHGDFRTVLDSILNRSQDDDNNKECHYYDLVTGTPPYFRVDFTVQNNNDKVVQKAVIQQGGMPTCKQSAPARCEFRGGIEAYCQAASTAMHRQSIFCVCENWLNNDRVYQGAAQAGLVVVQVLPIQGRTGKPCPLFAVYVMRKQSYFHEEPPTDTQVLDCVSVRDDQGNWTPEYQQILQAMSIPVMPVD